MRVEAEEYQKYNRNIVLSPQHRKIEEIHLTPAKKSKKSLEKTVAIEIGAHV